MKPIKDLYEIVSWPDCQFYMNRDGFEKNACLADSDVFVEMYGSSAYFINSEWKIKIDIETDDFNYISALLAMTSEKVHLHLKPALVLDIEESQGLSELEKPELIELWQNEKEGIISFKLAGSDTEFDLSEYPELYKQIIKRIE